MNCARILSIGLTLTLSGASAVGAQPICGSSSTSPAMVNGRMGSSTTITGGTVPRSHVVSTHIDLSDASKAVLKGIKLEKSQEETLKPVDKLFRSREESINRVPRPMPGNAAMMRASCDQVQREYLSKFDSLSVLLTALQKEYLTEVRAALTQQQHTLFDTNRDKLELQQKQGLEKARKEIAGS